MVRRILILTALLVSCMRAFGADAPLEYQVKAVCMLNVARMVSWPAGVFADANAPLVIGVFGENPFGTALQEAVKGETVQKRRIVVRRVSMAEITGCHMLFVSRSEQNQLDACLRAAGGASVLTISEIERFPQSGGMVGLALIGGRIRFEINAEAAWRAGLRIDPQFLRLARITK
jgi:hypothetical protein